MTDWCKESLSSPEVKCAYLAVVLVLIVLVFMHVWKIGYHFNERFQGQQPAYVYSSNRLAKVNQCDTFSSSNQGDPSSCMSEIENGSLENPATAAEGLTASRGMADLWAVGHDMAAYKAAITGQTPGLDPNRQGMRMENMTSEHVSNPKDDMYERMLHQQALIGS
jgi:hypothetical protein